MSRDATSFYEQWPAAISQLKDSPGGADLFKSFGPFFQGLMKDSSAEGGLSTKYKELVALAIGVASRCEACIYTHIEKCLKAGATPREVMDATAVAVMMGGGPAFTYATIVASALHYWESKNAKE